MEEECNVKEAELTNDEEAKMSGNEEMVTNDEDIDAGNEVKSNDEEARSPLT